MVPALQLAGPYAVSAPGARQRHGRLALLREGLMPEDRERRDDECDRHVRPQRCRPHYGDLCERLELIRRPQDRDDAIEVLKTIIDAAFYEGCACSCCECHHEERDERE